MIPGEGVLGVIVNEMVGYCEVLYYNDGYQHLEVFDNDEIMLLDQLFDRSLYDL